MNYFLWPFYLCVFFWTYFYIVNIFNFCSWKTDYFQNVPLAPLYSSLVYIFLYWTSPIHPYLWLTTLFSLMTPKTELNETEYICKNRFFVSFVLQMYLFNLKACWNLPSISCYAAIVRQLNFMYTLFSRDYCEIRLLYDLREKQIK